MYANLFSVLGNTKKNAAIPNKVVSTLDKVIFSKLGPLSLRKKHYPPDNHHASHF